MRVIFLILWTSVLIVFRCRAAEPLPIVVPQSKLSIDQVQRIAAKQARRSITHGSKGAHVRIVGLEWVHPRAFEQENFTSSHVHLLDHKEEWSWMIKFFVYDDANEQKPYSAADVIRVLDDGSIGEMDADPVL